MLNDAYLDRMATRGLLCVADLRLILRAPRQYRGMFANCGLVTGPESLLDWSIVRWNRKNDVRAFALPKSAIEARALAREMRQKPSGL